MGRLWMVGAVALALLVAGVVGSTAGTWRGAKHEYVVLYAQGVPLASARLAVARAGGTIARENAKIGVATVTSRNAQFVRDATAQRALAGVAMSRPIGRAPMLRPKRDVVERLTRAERASARAVASRLAKPSPPTPAAEPLAGLQWDMAMIHATTDGSYSKQLGDRGVRVGIMDTGIDASHPDLAPNFDAALSRNFTTDIPSIDGACASDPDGSCSDPANVDENGHGTHVAGTVGAALNGLGIAGVAPNVTLVNLRAGQDSGFFFLQPTVDALTYAGDHGIDVVNMSYFIDPWLFNCGANPADSPAQQEEQRTIVDATNRALDYAFDRGVTLIAALGNEHTDLDNPTTDTTSPDFPPGSAYPRTVDNSCLVMPTEGNNVISVIALGPSAKKADYSNYGTEGVVLSAPGGWFRDGFGTPTFRTNGNLILSSFPKSVLEAGGKLNPDGTPNDPSVIRDCQGSTCGYYEYLQGTSMASPHAVGVAALIVSERGHKDPKQGGLTLKPKETEKWLVRSATDHACPVPPLITYTNEGRPADFNALCAGTTDVNNIYGEGIVDALAALKNN